MKITTDLTEIGLVARKNGSYELALYRRSSNRLIRFEVDATLAWAISGTLGAPITSEALATAG